MGLIIRGDLVMDVDGVKGVGKSVGSRIRSIDAVEWVLESLREKHTTVPILAEQRGSGQQC